MPAKKPIALVPPPYSVTSAGPPVEDRLSSRGKGPGAPKTNPRAKSAFKTSSSHNNRTEVDMKIGDIVLLKGQKYPKMTITEVVDKTARCMWFIGRYELREKVLPLAVLVKIQ
jgi:uncharacterized protein YodC (DUF2158 family)